MDNAINIDKQTINEIEATLIKILKAILGLIDKARENETIKISP